MTFSRFRSLALRPDLSVGLPFSVIQLRYNKYNHLLLPIMLHFKVFLSLFFDKYKKYYTIACNKIAEERNRFVKLLKNISWLKVYPSQANYVLCKITGKISSEKLAIKLLDEYNIFIKDLSSKKGFENGQYIRLAVRNTEDNDKLIAALKEI